MASPVSNPPAPAKPARNRKSFIRTNVPVRERFISAGILCLLVAIAVAIWIKGHHFDPNRFAARVESLKATAAPVEGKSGTVRAADARPEEAAPAAHGEASSAPAEGTEPGESASAPASNLKREPLEVTAAGAKPMGPTEFYGPNNLFEKIDGRAPAYLGFNFQQLRCRSFSLAAAAGSFVDVFEYRFDTPINAFGMFALERDPKGQNLAFAPDGYSGEMGFFFRQGNCYVQVIASDLKPPTVALARSLAEERAKALPVDDAGLDARRRLPTVGLLPETVAFVQENALGQAFLKNVFQANYDFSGKKLPFFLMKTTPEDAAAAWKQFLDFCGQFGGKATPLPDTAGAKLFQAENFGTWKVIYQKDGEIGGVFDADDGDKARAFVEAYLAGKLN